jgi:hypothetical protein
MVVGKTLNNDGLVNNGGSNNCPGASILGIGGIKNTTYITLLYAIIFYLARHIVTSRQYAIDSIVENGGVNGASAPPGGGGGGSGGGVPVSGPKGGPIVVESPMYASFVGGIEKLIGKLGGKSLVAKEKNDDIVVTNCKPMDAADYSPTTTTTTTKDTTKETTTLGQGEKREDSLATDSHPKFILSRLGPLSQNALLVMVLELQNNTGLDVDGDENGTIRFQTDKPKRLTPMVIYVKENYTTENNVTPNNNNNNNT